MMKAGALKEGHKAPDFELPSTEGRPIRLSAFRGKKTVILYFYPKDDTPGCTKEACGFQDARKMYEKAGVAVLGVSRDDLESHQRFRAKYGLSFPLLSDEGASVSKAYGVYKQRRLYGKTYMGIERTTFVIGRDGRIQTIFPKVQVDGHVEEVLQEVRRKGA